MGGGGGGPATTLTPVAVPSVADEEAAAERARLYSLLRSRRGGQGLIYGARPRLSLPTTKPLLPAAQAAGTVAPIWDPFAGGGGNPGGYGAGDSGGPSGTGGIGGGVSEGGGGHSGGDDQ